MPAANVDSPPAPALAVLPVAALDPNPDNLRDLDTLSTTERAGLLALGESLRDDGQKQPLRVVRRGDRFLIVSGHRRFHAARLVGLPTLQGLVLDAMPSPAELLLDQLVENGQRADFSDVERMEGYQRLLRLNPGWTLKDLAAALKAPEGSVSRVLTLKRLCPELQARVRSGDLPGTLAYHIARVGDPEKQTHLAALVAGGLTRDALAARVQALLAGRARTAGPPPVFRIPFTGLEGTAKALAAKAEELRAAARKGLTDAEYALLLRRKGGA